MGNAAYSRAWHKAHPGKHTEYNRRMRAKRNKAYGYPENGCCNMCGLPPTLKRKLNFDHDHRTGTFRGWLCHQCNLLLGMADDSVLILEAAIRYLQR